MSTHPRRRICSGHRSRQRRAGLAGDLGPQQPDDDRDDSWPASSPPTLCSKEPSPLYGRRRAPRRALSCRKPSAASRSGWNSANACGRSLVRTASRSCPTKRHLQRLPRWSRRMQRLRREPDERHHHPSASQLRARNGNRGQDVHTVMEHQAMTLRSPKSQWRRGDDSGFTLVEVMIALVLSALIVGVITAALITSLNVASSTTSLVTDSSETGLVSAYLFRDAQRAGGIRTSDATPDATLAFSPRRRAPARSRAQSSCDSTGTSTQRPPHSTRSS